MQPEPRGLEDYLSLAKARLDAKVWHHLQQGDCGRQVQAFQQHSLMPRPLRPLAGGHTRLTLLRQTLAHPIMLAPVAYQRLFHPEGETASALAASAQSALYTISSLASQPLEVIAQAAASVSPIKPWFQLYWQGQRDTTLRLVQRAIAAGCSAIVLTVDAPIKQASLVLPSDVWAVNLEPNPSNPTNPQSVFDGWMAWAPTWDDVAWLRDHCPLPLLLKGLLHPEDALACAALGCDGVVVSSHGGRVLQGGPASLDALSNIVKAVKPGMPVLFDSGVRSGRDVFVALALGATAVLVGRPYLWGLSANGALGVAHVIRLLRDELEMTMALTGCKHLSDISTQCLA